MKSNLRDYTKPGSRVRHVLNPRVRGIVTKRTEGLDGSVEIRVSYICSNNDPSDRWGSPVEWEKDPDA